ncbi:hypothetical protein V6Z11_D11G136500 [Gossypium hirsutum]
MHDINESMEKLTGDYLIVHSKWNTIYRKCGKNVLTGV